MDGKIQELLEKQCKYIEFTLKNGDTFSIYKPNQDERSTIELVDGNSKIKILQTQDDGCTYETYINIVELSNVTGLYNCPESVDGLFDEDEVDESV